MKRALQNRERSDEAVQQRHSQRTEADDQIDRGEIRHGRRQAAELRNHARVTPLVKYTHNQEQRAGRDAVVDLLEHAAGQAVRRECENSQRAEAEMADRAVGDQPLHVLLHEANERAINDADQGEHDYDVNNSRAHDGVRGQQREREPDETVRAHFQQDPRQNHGAGRGRFGMRVGEPRVEREHGNLDGKREEETPEEPHLQWIGKVVGGGQQRRNIEGACPASRHRRVEVQRQDRQQHDHRSGQRIQEKLDGCVQAPVAPPHADQEVHRDKHHFPEHIKEEKIQGNENADHPGLQQEQQNVILLGPLMNRAPRREDGDHPEKRGEHNKQEADAVDAQMIFRADRRDPLGGFLEGKGLLPRIPPAKQRKRNKKTKRAKYVSSDLMRVLHLARNEEQHQGAQKGHEQNHAQNMICKKLHSHRLSAHAAQQNLHMVTVIRQKNYQSYQNQHRVAGKDSGLQQAHRITEKLHQLRAEIQQPIDDPLVPPHR